MDYLSQKGVSFTAKDIANDKDAFKEFAQLKTPGTPTIVIENDVVVGFDPKAIDSALA